MAAAARLKYALSAGPEVRAREAYPDRPAEGIGSSGNG
jgi:hypothetical protein